MENTGFTSNCVLEDFGLARLMYMEVEENFFHVATKRIPNRKNLIVRKEL